MNELGIVRNHAPQYNRSRTGSMGTHPNMSGADSGSDAEASSWTDSLHDSDSNRMSDSDSDGNDLGLAGFAPGSDSSTLIIGNRLVHIFFEIERNPEREGSLTLNIRAYPDPVRRRQVSHLSLMITLDPLNLAVVFRCD